MHIDKRIIKRKLNLNEQNTISYGDHRSGWSFAINSIKDLHNPDGIFFDSFIERTFCWSPEGIQPNLIPWIGVIHVPPKVPEWFSYENSNDFIFSSQEWKESLPFCKGLYTLSKYHMKNLATKVNAPVNSLIHPTEEPSVKWSWNRFHQNKDKKVIQVGFWLRKLYSIYFLEAKNYQKIFLRKKGDFIDELLKKEREFSEYKEIINDEILRTTSTITYLPNEEYDRLLTENIVFLDLYDASANNSIIECMVRNTPILVNAIEPVIEYLGSDYPFYFKNLEEAALKLADMELIKETHEYLKYNPMKKKLSGSYFRKSIIVSDIYRNI
ncbi:MAG: hypothetical protein HQ541_20680 [Mariniphaga sp.]|nr:hypothetical protein [Mariniphaga sp.]